MKQLRPLLACALLAPLCAETLYTIPQGYTKITVAAATANGSTLTSISANLLSDVEYSGSIAIDGGSFDPDPDNDPQTNEGSQEATVSGVTWTANQFANPSTPYLAYLVNSAGAEEAFLITANDTSGTLTLSTSFDLLADGDPSGNVVPRHPANTTVKIRKANTLGSIFESGEDDFVFSDVVYVWTGSDWKSFNFSPLGFWSVAGAPTVDVNSTVIFPDEGMFILRTDQSDIVLTLFGEVPAISQTSTVAGSSFMASRYPVPTKLMDLGIDTDNWTFNDIVYIWNQGINDWDAYVYSPLGKWTPSDDPVNGDSNNLTIPANSAVFVVRSSEVPAAEGGVNSAIPYDPFAE